MQRLREFTISINDLSRILKLACDVATGETEVSLPVHDNGPFLEGVKLLHVYCEPQTRTVILVCEHESFDEVMEFNAIQRFDLTDVWREKRLITTAEVLQLHELAAERKKKELAQGPANTDELE